MSSFRDGCRPYLEIYNEDRLILSTLQDYDRLHLFNMAEGKVLKIEIVACIQPPLSTDK